MLNSLAMSVFPDLKTGRLPHQYFRGLLSVHSRYGLHTRRVAFTTLYTEGSGGSLPTPPLRLLPAGAIVAGLDYSLAGGLRLYTAHFRPSLAALALRQLPEGCE